MAAAAGLPPSVAAHAGQTGLYFESDQLRPRFLALMPDAVPSHDVMRGLAKDALTDLPKRARASASSARSNEMRPTRLLGQFIPCWMGSWRGVACCGGGRYDRSPRQSEERPPNSRG